MLGQFNGRIDIALAGYNSGESRAEYRNAAAQGREINWSVMPAGVQSETQNYVKTIMRNANATPAIGSGSGIIDILPIATGGSSSNIMLYVLGFALFVLIIDEI